MTKLNLGSKNRKLEGFENLDKIFGWYFQDGLPNYLDNSVDGITISHALMFLTNQEIANFFKEAWRVLKPNGVIRITEDDTENPKSVFYQTGNIESKPSSLTGPKIIRQLLEEAGFTVYDVDRRKTYFSDQSLMQAYRGGQPNFYFIEGVKIPSLPADASALLTGIQQKGDPFEIPNCSRDDLPQLFLDLGFKVGAEIGIYKGEFSEKLAKKGLKIFCIDPWKNYKDFYNSKGQERMDFLYEHTKRVLTPYPNATIIRKSSMDAIDDFEDESLDFVYIDANHEFRYIAEDLYEWSKKVRKGGIVSGHDYFFVKSGTNQDFWHVAYVLEAFIKAFGIENWYLLGRKNPKEGEKRDRWRSWLFFKE